MSAQSVDINGYVEVKGNPISKVGVYPYLGREIGAPEPDRVYKIYRPEEELSSPETIASFKLVPLVDEHAMLGSEDGGFEPHIRLWREAQVLADKDPEIKSAYLLTMRMWHEETANIITQGQKAGEFLSTPDAADVAWRLIALVCGLDGMYVLGIEEMADPAFEHHLDRMITLELFS